MTNVETVPWSPELVGRVDALLEKNDRVMLGITGPPGTGKSTLAASLVASARGAGTTAVSVPMDGFHLAEEELIRLGRRDRKGAVDTFDGYGYLALLQRIRARPRHVVYAPAFDRGVEMPVAGSVPVPFEATLVITEGNYLLDDDEPWPQVRDELTQVWYLDTPWYERHRRLLARHQQYARSAESADAWVNTVDEPNARRVEQTRGKADLIVTGTGHPPR